MPNSDFSHFASENQISALIDRAAELAKTYCAEVTSRDVRVDQVELESLEELRTAMPQAGTSPDQVLELLHRHGHRATMPTTGGRYFGFVNGGVLPIGLAARLLSDAWDQNAALEVMSPVSGLLEDVCQSWLRDLFELPSESVAGFVTGSSVASLVALATARNALLDRAGWDLDQEGLYGAPP